MMGQTQSLLLTCSQANQWVRQMNRDTCEPGALLGNVQDAIGWRQWDFRPGEKRQSSQKASWKRSCLSPALKMRTLKLGFSSLWPTSPTVPENQGCPGSWAGSLDCTPCYACPERGQGWAHPRCAQDPPTRYGAGLVR